jgi:hypothetical protein
MQQGAKECTEQTKERRYNQSFSIIRRALHILQALESMCLSYRYVVEVRCCKLSEYVHLVAQRHAQDILQAISFVEGRRLPIPIRFSSAGEVYGQTRE